MDCGRALPGSSGGEARPQAPSGGKAASVPPTRISAGHACPSCQGIVSSQHAFCPHCGSSLGEPAGPVASCPRCGARAVPGFKFCGACGASLTSPDTPSGTHPLSIQRPGERVELAVIDDSGKVLSRHVLEGPETTVGRQGSTHLQFPDDPYLSPVHAVFLWSGGDLAVRDLGSRNGTWVFLEGPYRMMDGDLLLVGSQVLRFRRLGYPGPHPPEVDATRRMGSLVPSADIASLTQLRGDGSARDVLHLSPGRDVTLGRERGDWIFPYDPSMSGQHALVRSEDADFVVVDQGSRNGIALAVRGEASLGNGSRVLLGDKLLRIEVS